MGIAAGKRILVTGVRNKWSIAWHCALSLFREGADLAFSMRSEREHDDARKLLDSSGHGSSPSFLCDATKPEEIDALAVSLEKLWPEGLHGLVHAMAFAKREDLAGEFATTSQDGFALAMDASAWTLVGLSQALRPQMAVAGGGSVVTLTYLGSERVVSGYNVMGVAKAALESSVRYLAYDLGKENIRVNAVSAGPIKTLAASGVAGLTEMIQHVAEKSPLKRSVDADEVGDACAFLLSDLSRGITGEVLYVDAGFNTVGM